MGRPRMDRGQWFRSSRVGAQSSSWRVDRWWPVLAARRYLHGWAGDLNLRGHSGRPQSRKYACGCPNRFQPSHRAGQPSGDYMGDTPRVRSGELDHSEPLVSWVMRRRARLGGDLRCAVPITSGRFAYCTLAYPCLPTCDRHPQLAYSFGKSKRDRRPHVQPKSIGLRVAVAFEANSTCPIAQAFAKTVTQALAKACCQSLRSPGKPLGLQLLRSGQPHPQPTFELLLLFRPLCQHVLDRDRRLCRAMCQWKVEPLRRRLRRVQLQRRSRAIPLQRAVKKP